jgi:hypothetical protein
MGMTSGKINPLDLCPKRICGLFDWVKMGGVCPKSLANEHKVLFVSGCINDLTNVRDVLFKGFGIPEGLLRCSLKFGSIG